MANIFEVRALETHDTFLIWNLSKIRRVLDFMVRNDMNTLIFHENDIVDKVVYPGLLYDTGKEPRNSYDIYREIYKKIYDKKPSPYVFIDEKLILQDLLRIVIEEVTESGIEVYLQTKELWFPDLIYESELVKDGVVCPSESFWWEEFLPAKYTELVHNLPLLAGIVTSTGTRESRASLAHNKCHCDSCQSFKLNDWQKNIIMAIYKPLKEAGKKLVVRDFTYYSDEQDGFRSGIISLPDDIIISIKNTPQDFYPTFPHNQLIGKVGKHAQWIEYEVMGEYYGFGVAPCILLKDIRERMKYSLERGATGFTARIDWEALPNHSCFETPNLLNLYGIANLGKNTDLPLRDVYYRWLTEEGLIQEDLPPKELNRCVEQVMHIFEQTWPIMEKTPYINGYLFSTNSKIPVSIENGDFIAREHHGMQKWFPNRSELFTMNDKNVKYFLAEKDQAVEAIKELCKRLRDSNPGLKPDVYKNFTEQFDIFEKYVKMFYLVGRSYILIKYLQEKGKTAKLYSYSSLIEMIQSTLSELKALEDQFRIYSYSIFKYPATSLLSVERIRCFREDTQRVLQSIQDEFN
jgi:hypothetical protein